RRLEVIDETRVAIAVADGGRAIGIPHRVGLDILELMIEPPIHEFAAQRELTADFAVHAAQNLGRARWAQRSLRAGRHAGWIQAIRGADRGAADAARGAASGEVIARARGHARGPGAVVAVERAADEVGNRQVPDIHILVEGAADRSFAVMRRVPVYGQMR